MSEIACKEPRILRQKKYGRRYFQIHSNFVMMKAKFGLWPKPETQEMS